MFADPMGVEESLRVFNGVCKGFLGAHCEKEGDCFPDLGCLAGICKPCDKAKNGKCLTPLGQTCIIDEECITERCDDDTKVCVHKTVKCEGDNECLGKIRVPDEEVVRPYCDNEECKLCVLSGNPATAGEKCCNRSDPHEEKCLNSIGGDCQDPKECISGNCVNGKCVADGAQPSNGDAKCGDLCCNGMETTLTCPGDCPQRPTVPPGCIPNLSVGEGLVCETECSNRLLCGGGHLVSGNSNQIISCNCSAACQADRVCFGKRCETPSSVCETLCLTATGKKGFSDGVRTIECSCGGVTSDASINTITVRETVCQSRTACIVASSVCRGGLRCCSSASFSYPGGGGKCIDPAEVQPEDTGRASVVAE